MRSFYSPLSISAPFYEYSKLIKATQKGKKFKQGCKVTGPGIELGTCHTKGGALTNYAIFALNKGTKVHRLSYKMMRKLFEWDNQA